MNAASSLAGDFFAGNGIGEALTNATVSAGIGFATGILGGDGIRYKNGQYAKTKQAMNVAKTAVDTSRNKTERHATKLVYKSAKKMFEGTYANESITTLGYCLLLTPLSSAAGKGTSWLTERIFS